MQNLKLKIQKHSLKLKNILKRHNLFLIFIKKFLSEIPHTLFSNLKRGITVLKRSRLPRVPRSEWPGSRSPEGDLGTRSCHRALALDKARQSRANKNFSLGNFYVFKTAVPSAGFTLLEMIVSIGIFSILIVIAIGIVLSISNAQIKAANVQNVQDNIRFTLELITKELRVGSGYAVYSCAGNFCQQINFTTANGEARGYCLEFGVIKRLSGTTICGFGSPMTSSNVVIDRLYFIASGIAVGGSDGQPSVTVVLQARSADPRRAFESNINVQTTIVQRLRDI